MAGRSEEATLGGGCFWCLEAVFQELAGVESVVSGYAGGSTSNPTYEQVCSGRTGHAEVVQVRFDPDVLDYKDLLRVFFAIHDPTTKDRQGADSGTQYRSAILHHSEAQRVAAETVMREVVAEGHYSDLLVTEIEPLSEFWSAESYHADYYRSNPAQPYCRVVIDPKMAKLRKRFRDHLRTGT
jgi:peptide-methionine (S)-S-oxide reductase